MISILSAAFSIAAEAASVPHVIIDAGSSGTRMYLFWHNLHQVEASSSTIKSTVVGRIKPGLSDLDEEDVLLDRVAELFNKAADMIPEEQREHVPVWILGTAGMRAIDTARQAAIWRRVHQHDGFKLFGSNITAHTIDGRTEGLYSLTCVNYLAAHDSNLCRERPFGILDLGGSSTQIARPARFQGDEVFIRSFSDAGLDVTLEKLGDRAEACQYKRHETGSIGNATACRAVIAEVVGPTIEQRIRKASVRTAPRMQFIAVSGYDYVMDFVNWHIGLAQFPRPSLREIENKVDALCATEWETIKEASIEKPHQYTHTIEKASLRCYEANYIIMILRWYGFTRNERRINFVDQISGHSVEWPMGALLDHFDYRSDSMKWSTQDTQITVTADAREAELDDGRLVVME